jgi:lipoic acid synthetase
MMKSDGCHKVYPSKPSWIRVPFPHGKSVTAIRELKAKKQLHTVCESALCPNIAECWGAGQATFMIMGDGCTRDCLFCAVNGKLKPIDSKEAYRVAEAVSAIGLKHAVITSVTRDDLVDGGAAFFAETIEAVHRRIPAAKVEVLVPDFQGRAEALQAVLDARPDVLNHNIETVPRLYATVRPQANYRRSLQLLSRVKEYAPGLPIKSGLMLGLGESSEEVRATLKDLIDAGCRILTLGQYLQPSKAHLPVERFVPPEEFEHWRQVAIEIGFSEVASGPFVRSSYHAKELYQAVGPLILKRNIEV